MSTRALGATASRLALALSIPLATQLCVPRIAAAQDGNLAWGYNSYGIPGVIDMPAAHSREDAELGFNIVNFAGQTRVSAAFQITPRLSAGFRYSSIQNYNGGDTLFDRSFSYQYRFLDERRLVPAMAVGVNDMLGTGVYAGEYVVASKTLTKRLRATAGIGWGRLGSFGSFENPLGALSDSFKTRPKADVGKGGTFHPDQWFHGPAALFAGVEWQATDKLRLMAEYSSDDYTRENGPTFTKKSPFNFAASYQINQTAAVTAGYLYGSALSLQLSFAINPKHNAHPSGLDPAPPPVVPRPVGGGKAAQSWSGDPSTLENALKPALAQQGLALEAMRIEGRRLAIQIRNDRYGAAPEAIGRAARVLSATAPVSVDRFAITLSEHSMPVSTTELKRDDLEAFEFHPVGGELIRANAAIDDAAGRLPPVGGVYPRFSWNIGPYLRPAIFDPDQPVRADLGAKLTANYEPLPGLLFTGQVTQKALGNLDQANRPSDSVLPHVRSDAWLYYKESGPQIPQLTAAYFFRPGRDLYGRFTIGYLEPMFAGVSAELLWSPQNSRLALGAEVNRVRQRGYDQRFDLRDYEVTTGHLSAYYQLNDNFFTELDVGRYLAGDYGATLSFSRVFDNGWKVGVYATKTNVSSAEFGEGSFDKGFRISVPLGWVSGKPTRESYSTVIQPIVRDGGARLYVPDRLYGLVHDDQASTLDGNWERFWR
ncbi:YjbH domain-containing protein [Thioclava atlantica]|uniref:Uncharacterized protein n=1 Tax=Thioclava atlantica TaxID=1317124 RepID=A0A085TRB9_9RHOB|nr:YjbH domain-containing protein [Thioclava atlantica]KFE33266.1 hypothetical protein DW2_18844 [Thioclava atlantica]